MPKVLKSLAFLLLTSCLVLSSSEAGFLKTLNKDKLQKSTIRGPIAPNEFIQKETKDLFAQIPKGVLVGVGADRLFILAGQSSNITHLLATDYDSNVVLFNTMNIGLLKLSESREHYLTLRVIPEGWSIQDFIHNWVNEVVSSEWIDSPTKDFLLQNRSFWIDEVVRTKDIDLQRFHGLLEDTPDYYFEEANYLFDDELFSKLQKMAREDRMEAISLDYNQPLQVRSVMQAIHAEGLKLSVLDLSNAWWKSYIKPENLEKIILYSSEIALPKSTLLLTNYNYIKDLDKSLFTYIGFDLQNLMSPSNKRQFFSYLQVRDPEYSGEKQRQTLLTWVGSTQFDPHLISP